MPRLLAFSALVLSLPAALAAQSTPPAALPVGEVATLAGPIEAGSGGVEVDADGNVYTADFGATLSQGPPGTRVWRVTPDGVVSVFAEGLRGASGNTMGADGHFYQSNIAAGTVSRISMDGTVTPFVTEGLRAPVGIVFAEDGRLMVANCGANTISAVDADGQATLFAESSLLQCPNGLVRDHEGNLYASNFANGDVVRITPAGDASRFASVPGNNNGHLVFTGDGFYVAARSAHQIVHVAMDGTLTVVAGSGAHGVEDGPALQATLSYPNDLGLSPDGTILYWNDVAAIVEDGGQTLAPTVVRMLRLR